MEYDFGGGMECNFSDICMCASDTEGASPCEVADPGAAITFRSWTDPSAWLTDSAEYQ